MEVNLDYDIYQMLDDGPKKACHNAGEDYNKDHCVDTGLEKKSMATHGCTSPFGPNKGRQYLITPSIQKAENIRFTKESSEND